MQRAQVVHSQSFSSRFESRLPDRLWKFPLGTQHASLASIEHEHIGTTRLKRAVKRDEL